MCWSKLLTKFAMSFPFTYHCNLEVSHKFANFSSEPSTSLCPHLNQPAVRLQFHREVRLDTTAVPVEIKVHNPACTSSFLTIETMFLFAVSSYIDKLVCPGSQDKSQHFIWYRRGSRQTSYHRSVISMDLLTHSYLGSMISVDSSAKPRV